MTFERLQEKSDKSISNNKAFVEGIKKGDYYTLRNIYTLYFERVATFVTKNNGSEEDAKDVFQDALMVLFKKITKEDLHLTCSFYVYLYSVCRKIWLKKLRDLKNIQPVEIIEDSIPVQGIDEYSEKLEREKLYKEKFGELGEICRKLLQLFFNGQSLLEISETLGLSGVPYTKKRKYLCQRQLIRSIKSDPRYSQILA